VSRLAPLATETFDLAIVGGGIIGCGIARDAALRGLKVALFERSDFGSGTTAASTRIVHGGLRYLEMLDFRLVRMDLRERETLLRIAPHLVRPLEFLIPFHAHGPVSPLKLRAGLALYDALSFDKSLPSRRWLPPAEARAADPALRGLDLRGAAAYYDARVDSPERLALENVLDAAAHGARALNYCEVVHADPPAGRLAVRDTLDGTEAQTAARVIVNATGAWFERTSAALLQRSPRRIRTTKGIHIVVPPLTDRALVLYSRVDRRLLFAIPRGGLTWIGTTDTDYEGDPANARATRADVEYLIESVADTFPRLTVDDVLYTTAGVRALVQQEGTESSVSRMHKIVEGEPVAPEGTISVLGGKITGYRSIAEDTVDAICRRLGCRSASTTAERPLPGASRANGTGAEGVLPHLYDLYGSRAPAVAGLATKDSALARPLAAAYPDIGAQVVFSARFEHSLRLSDFMRRRSLLGATADRGLQAVEAVAALMATEHGWAASRTSEEADRYRREVAASRAFRDER
jgi:glycerol-3-phosphate dehydrogenase